MTAQELFDYYIAHGADRDLITATTAKCELIGMAQSIDVSGIAAQDFARCFNADFAADLIDGVPEEIRSTLLDGFLPEFVYDELYDIAEVWTDIAADWSGRFTDIVIADGNVMEFKFRDSCDDIRYYGRRDPGDIFRIGNPEPAVWPPYWKED